MKSLKCKWWVEMLLRAFLKKTKGSITVMVTLIMIPTVFFTGFLVDLARIKLYSNQAVMAADNYGEAVLTEYDALLKELYGLFAVTQNEEGKKAIQDLQAYMKTSYDPSANMISWDHLGGIVSPLKTEYTGFMPYKSANVTLSYQLKEESRLSDPRIMSTQIGDFMRFRIVQGLGEDADTILDALEQTENTEGNAQVIEDKKEVDDAAGKAMERMRDYYDILKRLQHYPDYLKTINATYQNTKRKFDEIKDSSSFKIYRNYVDNEDEIRKARDKDEDDRDEEDEKYVEMGEAYDNDPQARENKLRERFDAEIDNYEESKDDTIVDFESFDGLTQELERSAAKVKASIDTLSEKKAVLEQSMQRDNISEDMKSGITEELQEIDSLVAGDFSGDNYIALAGCIKGNAGVNSDYEQQVMNTWHQLQVVRDDYLTPKKTGASSYKAELSLRLYDDFQSYASYERLYESLKKTFDNGNEIEEQAKQKKKEAEAKEKEAQEKMENDEETSARDIPSLEGFRGIGDTRTGGGFSLGDLIGTAANYFSCNSFGEAADKLLLKFYTVAYDFGMFSSRTTNVKKTPETGETAQQAVSLTGYKMGRDVNYLYQAELEYLFGGHKSSKENLKAAKNHILAFRTVVNFTSTYSVREINSAINNVRRSCSAINPVLGIAAAAALRAGVTALETAADWQELSQGNTVVLIKSDWNDLTAVDTIASMLGLQERTGEKSKKLSLDYDQYLMVMITFLTTSDQITKRTSDLITLNVNTVEHRIGEEGELTELTFKMDDAYTALDATCAIHLDFAVMPKGFAKETLDEAAYGAVESFEKNTYKFTVTRGY